jgi:hypothetical protein
MSIVPPGAVRGRAWSRILGGSSRGLLTASIAAILAAATALGPAAPAVVVAAALVVFSLGWSTLLALPSRRGSTAVVLSTGLLSLVVVLLAGDLVPLVAVVAFAVIAAFVHEMARGERRPLLTESLAGTVTGAVCAVSAAGWVAIGVEAQQTAVVLASGAALAAAGACTALPWDVRVTGALAMAGGALAGTVVGLLNPSLGVITAATVGAGAGLVTASLEVLFGRYPAGRRPLAGLTIAVLPIVVVGIPVYGVAQLLAA